MSPRIRPAYAATAVGSAPSRTRRATRHAPFRPGFPDVPDGARPRPRVHGCRYAVARPGGRVARRAHPDHPMRV